MAGGPESRGFQPFLPRFSLKSRPTSDSGRLRPSDRHRLRLRSSSGVVSSELLHCCLPTPIVCLSPQLVASFACTPLLPQDRAALLTLTALRLLVSLSCGFSLCASTALGRLSARVAALSFPLSSCLRRPSLCSVVRPRFPLFVASYRPCPSCDGVQLSHAAERAHRESVLYP